jgi:hypothetical protein
MPQLITDNNLAVPDDYYALLTELYRELEPAQCNDVNARLILLLGNHIGDMDVLAEAARIAREHLPAAAAVAQDI